MNQITPLRPISDDDAARTISRETHQHLTERITATAAMGAARRKPAQTRRWGIAVPVAVCVAIAIALASVIGTGKTHVGPVNLGPSAAQALVFTTEGRYIVVIVRNPVAEVNRYRSELAAHHLNVSLRVIPVSPSLVGTLVEGSGPNVITTLDARGKCWAADGGNVCPVGIKVPINFRGSASFTFGRAARPGEQYESAGSATAPGEAMYGLPFRGRTVATVLAWLRARHVTVPQYRWNKQLSGNTGYAAALHPNQVPKTWYVQAAIPWAPGQVLLFVSPHPKAQAPASS